jgi:hypothetical protein
MAQEMSITKTVDEDGNETTVYTGVDLFAFRDSLAEKAFGTATQVDGHCRRCKQPFSPDTVFTAAGWRETAISGICEKCFDEMYEE